MIKFSDKEYKIQYVLDCIEQGKDSQTIAKDLGYKNYKSLDVFMRKEGYAKREKLGGYYPKDGKGIIQQNPGSHNGSVTSKTLEVIEMFEEGKMSPKRIAHELGFETAKEMANYMKSKRFIWDGDRNNYMPEGGEDLDSIEDIESNKSIENTEANKVFKGENMEAGDLNKYSHLLEYLDNRKDKLIELMETNSVGTLPRYVVPGISLTKSVHMSNQLDQMVRDFSADNNMSQKDVFEIALIDFFNKYGYHREVEIMLTSLD